MGRKPRGMEEARRELTPLELDLMEAVWERGDATAAEIGQWLEDKRPLAGTTIHTVLSNLRKKGFIEPIPTVERVLRFAPCVSREQVAGRTLSRLIGQFFGGSPQRLMAHLVREGEVGEKELQEIRRLMRQKPAKKGTLQ